ncbi:MAG TPA: hypothetical protein VFN48_11015 [Solirubrobacteraceae bacterium]|nr:hypothetical protein [Solirubrobacteraceae bacterium]
MSAVHIAIGSLAIALNLAAGLWGAFCWWRRRASSVFWILIRAAQVAVVLEAVLGGIWILTGRKATELHLIYGLVPIGVAFMGEQLRISAAQMVLDKRGHASTKEVGKLPATQQREIVIAIVRQEIGVMTLAALVSVVLLARAAAVHG